MNNKFLKNPEYSIGMQEVIKRAASKYSKCNPAIKWEMIKTEIIQYSQLYAHEKAKYRKIQENMFQRYMNFLQKQFNDTDQEIYLNELNLVKLQYETVLEENLQKLISKVELSIREKGKETLNISFHLPSHATTIELCWK